MCIVLGCALNHLGQGKAGLHKELHLLDQGLSMQDADTSGISAQGYPDTGGPGL